ncbi:cuticle collagen 2 [Zootoca vivipara]|uniref:cuticle collagen 2 n=1 Tax=Zootoca vivipara TaxID=8524 RepID=UPI0015903E31|nr:cuticle collagen 2-like [Zootoca vivipara]XP_060127197.1 cuticle collagen 2 [Zootoca vivipara]
MNCGSPGRWPFCGMAPAAFLLVLCLQWQGSASRCIEGSSTEDLQPMPPGVQRNSLPSGLMQPDVSSMGRRDCIPDGGDTRIVGGSPATFGGQAGGSSTAGPSSPGASPFQYGKPSRPGLSGKPLGSIFGGTLPPALGAPNVKPGMSGGATQYGYGPGYNSRGFPRPVWKRPGLPYIPTAEERGGGYIPIRNEPPRLYPYGAGGAAAGGSAYSGGSVAYGPRGTYDGSYGPVPASVQPGGQRDSGDKGNPCTPNC